MAYATIALVTQYQNFDSDYTSDAADYTVLEALIPRAQAIIDTYTGRTFEQSSDIRYYDSVLDVDGLTLMLDEDLVTIDTGGIVNGDGTVLSDSDYVLEPRNRTPKFGITLKGSTGYSWEADSEDDPENAISVDGKWGFSATAPDDIVHACIRLTHWLYKQRNAGYDIAQPAVSPQGVMLMPGALPRDIKTLLDPYRRLII